LNNINPDKEELLKLLQELEEKYNAGTISNKEYDYLSKEYKDKLSNMTAIDRIRAMQGKEVVEKPVMTPSKKKIIEKSIEEDEKLVDKFVVKTEEEKKESKTSKKRIFAAIAIICLVAAFITGIGFGIFNFDFHSLNPVNTVVTVNESAFPDVTSNSTNNTNGTNSTNNTNRTESNTTTNNNSQNSNNNPNSRPNTNTNKSTESNKNNKDPNGSKPSTRPSSNR